MTQIRFETDDGAHELGLFNWFAVHGACCLVAGRRERFEGGECSPARSGVGCVCVFRACFVRGSVRGVCLFRGWVVRVLCRFNVNLHFQIDPLLESSLANCYTYTTS
jgi:hypothetical protein